MDEQPMTFEEFCKSFYYGRHADMQFKFLARMDDESAADTVAQVLAPIGEALDTGDLSGVRDAVYQAQVAAYQADDTPAVDDAPFTPLPAELTHLRLAVLSAGGMFRADDDPMGPGGPSQPESLRLIKDFLRGTPTLSVIPKDTPDDALTARHPGYDAHTAQRDPCTVFPLTVLRDLEAEGGLRLADHHYAFTGSTSHTRLRTQVAPEWAQRLRADGVDACLLVATQPVCHQSVGLVARALEAAGIPTVAVFICAFAHVAGRLRVPRVLITPHLMGRTIGPAGDRARQRQVVQAALRLLAEADGPEARREL